MLERLFCMRLHTAGTVIGWLGIIGSFLATIILSVCLANADTIAGSFANSLSEYEAGHLVVVTVGSLLLAITILHLLSSALLLLGTMKNRHLLLLPWLINSAINLIFSIFHAITFMSVLARTAPVIEMLLFLIMSGLALALNIYIYSGIFSLYKHIQGIRDQERPVVLLKEESHQTEAYPNYVKL